MAREGGICEISLHAVHRPAGATAATRSCDASLQNPAAPPHKTSFCTPLAIGNQSEWGGQEWVSVGVWSRLPASNGGSPSCPSKIT